VAPACIGYGAGGSYSYDQAVSSHFRNALVVFVFGAMLTVVFGAVTVAEVIAARRGRATSG